MTTVSHTQNTLSPVSTCIFVEHREHSENEGTKCGSKVSSPVVSHSKVRRGYLYTEEHTWWRKEQNQQSNRKEMKTMQWFTSKKTGTWTQPDIKSPLNFCFMCAQMSNMAISHAFRGNRGHNKEERQKAVYLQVEYQSSSPPQQHSPLSGCLYNSMDSTDPERRKRRQDWHDRKKTTYRWGVSRAVYFSHFMLNATGNVSWHQLTW